MLGEELAKLIDERIRAEAAASDHQHKKSYGVARTNAEKITNLAIANSILHDMKVDLVNLSKQGAPDGVFGMP